MVTEVPSSNIRGLIKMGFTCGLIEMGVISLIFKYLYRSYTNQHAYTF